MAATPELVRDINPGVNGSGPFDLVAFQGEVYFTAGDQEHGSELWKSDGTAAGTTLVKDIAPGTAHSQPSLFTPMGEHLYFIGQTVPDIGIELWRTDGTAAGTEVVRDINPGAESSYPAYLYGTASTLYFGATTSAEGHELWKSDGTAAGTTLVRDTNPGPGFGGPILPPVEFNGAVYFASGPNGSVKPWKSDGTFEGTIPLRNDLDMGGTGTPMLTRPVIMGNAMYFSARQGDLGLELWRSDGTAEGTSLVKDINPGFWAGGQPQQITVVGDTLFFTATDTLAGYELWKTDGTESGTVRVKDIYPGTIGAMAPTSSPPPTLLLGLGGILYFSARAPVGGTELWRSDGTEAGTYLVKDINPGAASSNPKFFREFAGGLYFTADDANGSALWKSDGTAEGTVRVTDPTISVPYLSFPTAAGDRFYFSASTAEFGNELWSISLGTQEVSSFVPTDTGFHITLNSPVVVADLNLYDYRSPDDQAALGAADIRLTDANGKVIPGSLVVGADHRSFDFVATQGRLPAGTYTLMLRSAANGFHSANGELLDGNADGVAGGDFVRTFTVSAPAAADVVLSLPNFARGPQQAVNTPATTALGLPVQMTSGSSVSSLRFDLRFDPELLTVSAAGLPISAPAGSTVTLTNLGPGRVRVAVAYGSALPAGTGTAVYLTAAVPAVAATRYGERGLLDLDAILAVDQSGKTLRPWDGDAVQVNTYFGDVGRNGRYDSFDVQQTSRLALDLDTGFQQHSLSDPVLLADFNGNGRIDSFDVQRTSRLALNLPIDEAADLPDPLPAVTDTDRVATEEPPKTSAIVATSRSDIDGNGAVDPQDVLWAVYYFGESSKGALPDTVELSRVDVNSDGLFDAADVLQTIYDLAPLRTNSAGESTSSTLVAKESSADLDDLEAAMQLLVDVSTPTKKKHLI